MSQQPPSQTQQPQSPQQPNNQAQTNQQPTNSHKIAIIVALIGTTGTIIAALIGGIFLLASLNKGTVSSPMSTPVGTISVISNSAPTPTATPAPIIITENLQIPCASCGSPLGLELQSIEINRNDNTSAFHFKVTNNGSSLESVNFQQLSLQDDNGNTYNAEAGDITYLGPGNSEIVIRTFPLALKRGVHYTMSVTIDSSSFKDQSITVSY